MLAHESRQAASWLISDVRQKMRKPVLIFAVGAGLGLLSVVYSQRAYAFATLTRLGASVPLEDSRFRGAFFDSSATPVEPTASERRKIRWELWCVSVEANLWGAKQVGGVRFIRVTAMDRTDTEFVYVFDLQGRILEVIKRSMA